MNGSNGGISSNLLKITIPSSPVQKKEVEYIDLDDIEEIIDLTAPQYKNPDTTKASATTIFNYVTLGTKLVGLGLVTIDSIPPYPTIDDMYTKE